MENDYVSIADFAELVGVSKQAIYKRLKKDDIKPHIKMIDKKVYLSISACELFNVEPQKAKQQVNETQKPEQDNDIISYLKEQIAKKDKIIEDLQASLIQQSQTLTEIVSKQNELQNNFQVLLARFSYLPAPKEEKKPSSETAEFEVVQPLNNVEQPVVQPLNEVEQPVESPENEPKKKGFFRRLFKKD